MSNLLIDTPATFIDYEFIGFSFDGRHSSEFNLTAVISSGMYNQSMFAEFQDQIISVPGKDGSYYFGTNLTNKNLSITLAFDSLSGENYRAVKAWLNPKKLGKLIFDEKPYVYYLAKISGNPQFSFIPFDGGTSHIYKGTIMVDFVSLESYGFCEYSLIEEVPIWTGSAFSPVFNENNLPLWANESGLFISDPVDNAKGNGPNGYNAASISQGYFSKKFYNYGDIEVPIELTFTVASFELNEGPLQIYNDTNDTFIEIESLKKIKSLESNTDSFWTIYYKPQKGLLYTIINSQTYALGSVHNGTHILMSIGANVLRTNMDLSNVKLKYYYQYW